MNPRFLLALTAALTVLVPTGCGLDSRRVGGLLDSHPFEDLSGYRIEADRWLFARTGEYDLIPGNDPAPAGTVPLESLLDRSATRTLSAGGTVWTQIPFKETGRDAVLLTDTLPTRLPFPEMSRCRKYLIVESDGSGADAWVMTLVPYHFASDGAWDALSRRDFYGNILYASLDGELRGIENYRPGEPVSAARLVHGPAEVPAGQQAEFILSAPFETRLAGGTLSAAVCLATRSRTAHLWLEQAEAASPSRLFEDTEALPSGGGGGTRSRWTSVSLAALQASVSGNGSVQGNGMYPVCAEATLRATAGKGGRFLHWTGDIRGGQPLMTVTMDRDKATTAVFGSDGDAPPCYDAAEGRYFPLGGKSQRIAATASGSVLGGIYGNVRYGGARPHRGWDLAAAPGTPFYAPVGGTIADYIISDIPDGARGRSDCGNRIGITFTLGGRPYSIFFFHLGYTDPSDPDAPGNGIGVNPRTGERWKTGDTVFPGDLLGHTGDTGLACDVPNKHLHIQIHTCTDRWPSVGSGSETWKDYADPSLLFADALQDPDGPDLDPALHLECDGVPEADSGGLFGTSGLTGFYLYPGIGTR